MTKVRVFFLFLFAQGLVFGQTKSEGITEPESESAIDSLFSGSNQFKDSIHVSLSAFGINVDLVGIYNQTMVNLFVENAPVKKVNIKSIVTGENHYNEPEVKIFNSEEKTIELAFYDSVSINNETELFKLFIHDSVLDSIYHSEFGLVKNDESKQIAINNISIYQLSEVLKKKIEKYETNYWVILERFSFYFNGVLFDIPENIGFYVN